MKKLICVLLIAVLLCLSIPAMAMEASDMVGEWYLNYIRYAEKDFMADELGVRMTLTLNEDGTASLPQSAEGQSDELTCPWVMSEHGIQLVGEGAGMPFTYSASSWKNATLNLYLSEIDMMSILTHTPYAPISVFAESAEAFYGTWLHTYTYWKSRASRETTEELGYAWMTVIGPEGLWLFDVDYVGWEEVEPWRYTFEDGKLCMQDGENTYWIALNDDGSISYTLEGNDIYEFFMPVEE